MRSGPDRERGYWERNASRYDRAMRLLGGPLPLASELAARAVAGQREVLEGAAGTGLFTVTLARAAEHVVATDYADRMVEKLWEKVQAAGLRNVECRAADLMALPFPAESFDAVVAANVLHLVPDLPGALASLRAVLRPGGKLVVPTFCHGQNRFTEVLSRLFGLTGFPGHRRLSLGSLHVAVEEAGFRITHTKLIPGLFPIGHVEAERPAAP